jgi:hypothetical protein
VAEVLPNSLTEPYILIRFPIYINVKFQLVNRFNEELNINLSNIKNQFSILKQYRIIVNEF